jgi:hypothetical protein
MDNKILYTEKFTHHDLKFHKVGGNRTKDVKVGPDRRTDIQADSYIPPQAMFAGGITRWSQVTGQT